MAYNTHDIRFLFSCYKRGTSFKRVLTIGRSLVWVTPREIRDAANEFGIQMTAAAAEKIVVERNGYCEPLFEFLGAKDVQAMDISPYEGAKLIHDLNCPTLGGVAERFTAVIDGGSLEHVFNLVQAFTTCMDLTAVGGSFISLGPANNFLGHGFHQISPEFLFAALNPANGFEVKRMLMHENKKHAAVYEVMDPQKFGQRVTLCNRSPVYIKTWAVRNALRPLFETFPQQPDWQSSWERKSATADAVSFKARIRQFAQKIAPKLLAEYQRIRIETSQESGFDLPCYHKSRY